MEPLEFLRLVLPSPGHGLYCACELSQRKEHVFVATAEELLPHFDRWVKAKADTYFALATFAEDGSREAINARYVKSLFIDMDGYDHPRDAIDALQEFLTASELNDMGWPTVLISGGGLHAYWPFDRELDIASWRPIAENFKRLCKQFGLRIDNTVTADAARVLRPPGTINFKSKYTKPRKVRLVFDGGKVFSPEDLGAHIIAKLDTPSYTEPTNVLTLPGQAPMGAGVATGVAMFANSVTLFKNILVITQAGGGCAQLAHYIEHATEDGMEPLWRGLLSIAKSCSDGDKAGPKLSKMHPYPPSRHRQKWVEIKGPYPCRKFDSENPGVCPDCKHWNKITNPLALGRDVDTTTEEMVREVPVKQDSEVAPATETFHRPAAPRGYEYGIKGGVYKLGEEDTETGQIKKVQLISYDLYLAETLLAVDSHYLHLVSVRNGVPHAMLVPSEVLASKDTTMKALAKCNVIAEFSGNDKNLYEYLRACAGAQSHLKPKDAAVHYGWQDDNSFVHAGHVFRKGQEPQKTPMIGLDNILECTRPKGTLQDWKNIILMFSAKRLYKHLAVFLLGSAAPLMRYTDFAGLTVHCATRDSGTGKTLSLNMVSSVWGDPTKYKIGKGTSPVAMQQRLGLFNSIPLVVDEITENNRRDPEWFANALLAMTEGKGKERMDSNTNSERRNLTSWSTVAVMSSNTHAMDFLTVGRTNSSEGELLRLIEFKMHEKLVFTDAERDMLPLLEHEHFGVAGWHLAQYLVDHEAELGTLLKACKRRARSDFNMADDERYWQAGISGAMAVGHIFHEADIITLPLKEILAAMKDVINEMRDDIKRARRTVDDVLNEYITEHAGNMVVVRTRDDVPDLGEFRQAKEMMLAMPKGQIMGRVNVDKIPGWTDYYIPHADFHKHCVNRNIDVRQFLRDAPTQLNNGAMFSGDHKIDPMVGTPLKTAATRMHCFKVSKRNEHVEIDLEAIKTAMGNT